eukprot:2591577-Rhodomonas_salina.1
MPGPDTPCPSATDSPNAGSEKQEDEPEPVTEKVKALPKSLTRVKGMENFGNTCYLNAVSPDTDSSTGPCRRRGKQHALIFRERMQHALIFLPPAVVAKSGADTIPPRRHSHEEDGGRRAIDDAGSERGDGGGVARGRRPCGALRLADRDREDEPDVQRQSTTRQV